MIREQALHYLGYQSQEVDDQLDKILEEAIGIITDIASFRIIYGEFSKDTLDFSNKAYIKYIGKSNRVILLAATLGSGVDKKISKLMKTDMRLAIVCDAVANSILEYKTDEAQITWGYENLSYRFAPGYQGTDVAIIKDIARLLDANKKLGISVLESNIIVPKKSMICLLVCGKEKRRSCNGCIMINDCEYLRRHVKCY